MSTLKAFLPDLTIRSHSVPSAFDLACGARCPFKFTSIYMHRDNRYITRPIPCPIRKTKEVMIACWRE